MLNAFLAVLAWSLTVPLFRLISEHGGVLMTSACVFLIAAGVAGVLDRSPRRAGPMMRSGYALAGVFLAYQFALFFGIALAESPDEAVNVGLVNYLWPVFIGAAALPSQSGSRRLRTLMSLALGMYAVTVAMQASLWPSLDSLLSQVSAHPTPLCLGLMAAVLWAGYSVISRHREAPTVPWLLGGSGVIFLVLAIVTQQFEIDRTGLVLAIVLGIATAVGYHRWQCALRQKVSLTALALAGFAAPLLSVAWSWLLLDLMAPVVLVYAAGMLFLAALLNITKNRTDNAGQDI